MTKFIALLKGINVGGKNIIKMNELKEIFISIGYSDVQTYIQSGNVIFSSLKNKAGIPSEIKNAIDKKFHISPDIIVRSAQEFCSIIADCPSEYLKRLKLQSDTKLNKLYVGIMQNPLNQADILKIEFFTSENDEFIINENDIYLWIENGFGKSKLAASLSKAKTPITVRNWKTINKINNII